MQNNNQFIPYEGQRFSSQESEKRIQDYFEYMNKRRSVRDYSDKPVSKSLIENLIKTASSAPSGANKQPWTFCAVSNQDIKKQIRKAAEKEEYENYNGRMSQDWLDDLAKFGTDWQKPFLEVAPWLIVVFRKIYDLENGEKKNNYYVTESVGLACGFLLGAIHQAGLVSLTHTPSPLNFLQKILNRPSNEKPFLLIPVGYPAEDAQVPLITRKGLDDISIFYE